MAPINPVISSPLLLCPRFCKGRIHTVVTWVKIFWEGLWWERRFVSSRAFILWMEQSCKLWLLLWRDPYMCDMYSCAVHMYQLLSVPIPTLLLHACHIKRMYTFPRIWDFTGKKGWYFLKYWEVLSSFGFVMNPRDSAQRWDLLEP